MRQPDVRATTPVVATHRAPSEDRETFHDVLYHWMERAPWLALSAAAHLLALWVLSAFPWNQRPLQEPTVLRATLEQTPEEVIAEPPPEELEPLEVEPDLTEEPVLTEVLVPEEADVVDAGPESPFDGPPAEVAAPFAGPGANDEIGLGGGGGGGGDRIGRIRTGHRPPGVDRMLEGALEWLRHHQSADGSWDADGFSAECGHLGSTLCDGPGRAQHDVGVTGLALLAFLGAGNTTEHGVYREAVARGVAWLRDAQDPETGLLGSPSSNEFLYDHAIATLALCEAYYASGSPLLKNECQRAVWFLQRARNPYAAWRYAASPNGDNDTSVTGWAVFALKAARDAGLEVDEGAFDGALSWLDEVTDASSGRVGYSEPGSLSSRITGRNDHYPREKGEAMTAVGLLCRVFLGQTDPREHPQLERHGDLLLRTLPAWDPDGLGCDMYYWYYGSYAMYQLGGKHWKRWESAMRETLEAGQRHDGDAVGSWDPVGPWGFAGGRVYSTALMALSAESYFRYANLTGAR